jgi:nucleotide-binding universal stress UspA family protein
METTQTTGRPFVLVLGLDLKDTASSGFAFDQAARIAARIPDSQMHVVYAVPGDATADMAKEASGLLKIYVSEKWAALGEPTSQWFSVHLRRGDAGVEIARIAGDVGADAVFVGTHRAAHLKTLFVGSTAEHVMALAHCPVFVAGPKPKPVASHVIVIDPPCPDCVRTRAATAGHRWWCERHSESHHLGHHHVYSYRSELPFTSSDMSVNPAQTD